MNQHKLYDAKYQTFINALICERSIYATLTLLILCLPRSGTCPREENDDDAFVENDKIVESNWKLIL